MLLEATTPESFSFKSRPIPVPGDLRIGWRVALIILMLGNSRSKQASLAKLHILNDAIRSPTSSVAQLDSIVNKRMGELPWHFCVEPAFARAIDFAVGDKLAEWTRCNDRTALILTPPGISAFAILSKLDGVLTSERSILENYAKSITESAVTSFLGARRQNV